MTNNSENIKKENTGQFVVEEAYTLYTDFVRSGGKYNCLEEPHLLRLSLIVHDFYMSQKYFEAWIFSENNHNRIIKDKKKIYQEFDEHFFYMKRSAQHSGILYFAKALKSSKGDDNSTAARFNGANDVIKPIIALIKKHIFDNNPIIDEAILAAEDTRDKMIAHSDAELFDPKVKFDNGFQFNLNDFTKFLSDEQMVMLKDISHSFVYIISGMINILSDELEKRSSTKIAKVTT